MPKRFRWLPRTLAVQILLVLITCTVTPLLVIALLAGHTTQQQFSRFSAAQMQILESNHLAMYRALLEEQVNSMDMELRSAAQSVAMSRDFAEDLYSSPQDFPADNLSLVQAGRYLYEQQHLAQGSVQLVDVSKLDERTAEDLARSKYLSRVFVNEMSRNANLVAMYFTLPTTGSLYAAAPSNKLYQAVYVPAPDKPLTSYSFFKDALSVGPGQSDVVWTQPYTDITPNGRLFTVAAPVYDDSRKLRGVVSADITITDLQRNILDTRLPHDNGYAFLLDQSGRLITKQSKGPDALGGLKMQQFYDVALHGGYANISLNGEEHLIFARIVPSTNWLLGYVVRKDELFRTLVQSTDTLAGETKDRLYEQLLLLSLLSIALCLLLSVLLWTRISRPLKLLSRAFTDLGSGRFSFTAPSTHAEEFQQVLHAFNSMSGKIQELLEQQMNANIRLESTVAERTAQLHHTNEELNLRIGELTHLENWRKQWFAYVSHDLKTPATIASGFIQAILDGKVPSGQTSVYLAKIQDRIGTMNRLIQNLNELSLLETGQLEPRLHRIAAASFFRGIMKEWEDSCAMKGCGLIVDIPDTAAAISVDQDLIARAVHNLLDNAIKYSSPAKTVLVWVEVKMDAVHFHVKDEGIGIPADALPHIFDSFYRVDKSRNSRIQGSGLGLAIVKEIIQLHGGGIGVEAQQGSGSHFYFALPRVEESSSDE